jgi:hydroxymethylbilane synthase
MFDTATQILDTSEFLPAPAQGAIMIETHIDISVELSSLLHTINCMDTFDCITAERSFLKALDGNCRMPIAALAEIKNDYIILTGALLSENGTFKIEKKIMGLRKNAYDLGFELGNTIKEEFNVCQKP